MYPILFEVFGRPVGTYGLLLVVGAFAAWGLIKLLAGKGDKDVTLIYLMCICGAMIGAVSLRPITKIPEIIINWEQFSQLTVREFINTVFGQIVFYGGFIGGLVAMILYCRGFKIPLIPTADLFAPALPLAHGIGRIGCFFGGCCYGKQVDASHPFAVIFPQSSLGAPSGVPLLATQLIEAACLFIIAAILIIVYKKTAGTGLTVCLYGILYSILRFTLEFFRGDLVRGVYGPFSTSQYISIALFIVSVVFICMIINKRKKQQTSQKNEDFDTSES